MQNCGIYALGEISKLVAAQPHEISSFFFQDITSTNSNASIPVSNATRYCRSINELGIFLKFAIFERGLLNVVKFHIYIKKTVSVTYLRGIHCHHARNSNFS